MGFVVPEDLRETDLTMAQISQIVEIRRKHAENVRIINPPESVIEMAQARIAWAGAAEAAIRNGEEPPPYPKAR